MSDRVGAQGICLFVVILNRILGPVVSKQGVAKPTKTETIRIITIFFSKALLGTASLHCVTVHCSES